MDQKRNYQKELEKIISDRQDAGETVPTLFIHACCAPCSSHCLDYLCRYFKITVFYYNPNIDFEEEYFHRVAEEKRLIATYNEEMKNGAREGFPIEVVEGTYEPERFHEIAKGYEDCHEGGERCFRCYELRLRETAMIAAGLKNVWINGKQINAGQKFDYFTTTLTISPMKSAAKLNEIGEKIEKEFADMYGAALKWLPSDFKKKDGYKHSIELSRKYDLYRQDFCGCSYSMAERQRQKAQEQQKAQEEPGCNAM